MILKKITGLMLALTILCSPLIPVLTVRAVESEHQISQKSVEEMSSRETYGDYTYTVLEDGTLEITKYTGDDSSLTIPSQIKGKIVTKIGKSAFSGLSSLTSVVIPESVVSIEESNFYACNNLANITVPNSVTHIGAWSFRSTEWLNNYNKDFVIVGDGILVAYKGSDSVVSIPNSVKVIAGMAFFQCNTVTSINIPNTVTRIDDGTYSGTKILNSIGAFTCDNLNTINIPDSVEYIGNYAFYSCKNVSTVDLPNSVQSLGEFVFASSGLTSISLPNNLTQINEGTFDYCNKLTNVSVPNSIVSIKRYAFRGCSKLQKISLPDSVVDIGDYCFGYCSNLNDVYLGNSVEEIGEYLFRDCINLASISLPASLSYVSSYAFRNCTSLTSVIFQNSLKFIYNNAFEGCKNLKDVLLPDSLEIISYYAFYKCENLTKITIPNSVKTIGTCAFEECTKLQEITLSNSLESIGAYAFRKCSNLTDFIIPNSVKTIGLDAFCECTSLTSVVIPDSVTEIMTAKTYISSIPYGTFGGCINLRTAKIGKGLKTVTPTMFRGCTSLTNVEFPNNISSIGGTAFYGCTSLTSITIPDSVTNIQGSAFRECTSLTNITIPNSVNEISNSAFENCDLLTICGYENSYAQEYADKNGIPFIVLEKETPQKKAISKTKINITPKSYVYDGTDKKPSVTIEDGDITLSQNINYTLVYSNNVNVGTGQITITGIGDYEGTIIKEFSIVPCSMEQANITLDNDSFIYDGTEKKPSVTVTNGNAKLTQDTDFTVSYSNNVNVGTATVTVTGIENYTGTKTVIFAINPKPKTNISNFTLTLGQTKYTYDGTEKRPIVTVTNGNTKLTQDTDYNVSYSNNVNVGTATVTVAGIGDYTGTKTVNFTINAKSISDTIITLSQTSYTYDGTEKKPTVIVKYDTKTLSSETDYFVLYSNNINVGTAKVTISGKGNYTDSKSVNFEIKQKSKKFTNGADNWNFYNSRTNFGNSYYMNEKYWNTLLNGLSNTEKANMNKYVKNAYWGGSCYGMATTSILASNGILKPSQYQNGASFLHDISAPPTNEVKSLINYYFSLQFTDVIQQQVCKNFYNSDEKAKLNSLLSCLEDGSATLLCFHGYFYGDSDNWGGHAVVAYGVEYGTYSFNGKAFNGKILIYDNNNINYSDEFCLYFNSSNGTWIIPYYELDSNKGSLLGLITDDLTYVNYHGYLSGNSNIIIDDYIAILHSAAISGNYNLTKAAFANGTFTTTTTSDDDIRVFSSLSDNNFENSDIIFAMKDASSGYILKTSNQESLDLSMSYKDSLLFAEASNASTARFAPNAYVEIDGNKTDYNLGIVLNDGYKVNDWYGLSVEGKDADKVVLETTNDGYVLTSKDLNNISVTGYNDFVTVSTTFSTNYDKVYLYEIDENTIGVAVDTDNNGTYETTLNTVTQKPDIVDTDNETDKDKQSDSDKPSDTDNQENSDDTPQGTYGDLDGDGKITSADSLLILRQSVSLEHFTDFQQKLADVDGDGKITSADALEVLRYSVSLPTTGNIGKTITN